MLQSGNVVFRSRKSSKARREGRRGDDRGGLRPADRGRDPVGSGARRRRRQQPLPRQRSPTATRRRSTSPFSPRGRPLQRQRSSTPIARRPTRSPSRAARCTSATRTGPAARGSRSTTSSRRSASGARRGTGGRCSGSRRCSRPERKPGRQAEACRRARASRGQHGPGVGVREVGIRVLGASAGAEEAAPRLLLVPHGAELPDAERRVMAAGERPGPERRIAGTVLGPDRLPELVVAGPRAGEEEVERIAAAMEDDEAEALELDCATRDLVDEALARQIARSRPGTGASGSGDVVPLQGRVATRSRAAPRA